MPPCVACPPSLPPAPHTQTHVPLPPTCGCPHTDTPKSPPHTHTPMPLPPTCVWLSAAVENTWLFLVGMVVLRLIMRVNTPPSVSMPRLSGVTSSSRMSFTSPRSTPPWMAAPMATTSSGLTPRLGSFLKMSFTMSCTCVWGVWGGGCRGTRGGQQTKHRVSRWREPGAAEQAQCMDKRGGGQGDDKGAESKAGWGRDVVEEFLDEQRHTRKLLQHPPWHRHLPACSPQDAPA